jgi:predicted Zn-dependent peptidase
MPAAPPEPQLHTLANGVALLVLRLPQASLSTLSVFVRSGSAHEPSRLAGISHLVEHMVFKGSATRSGRQINLDAERLGAELNAHTDKDHTAFHLCGLAEHTTDFVRMLGDLVLAPSFPADELDRERGVVLQELAEDEDDAVSAAYRLFDSACFGRHPVARPIIGQRRSLQAITRDDLLAYTRGQYSGCNTVLAVAGPLTPQAVLRAAEPVFGALPTGLPHTLPPVAYLGGLRTKAMAGSGQTQMVLGQALPALGTDDARATLAATVLGEGMSSPLMDRLRERLGLVYFAAASADLRLPGGQFIVEASCAAPQLEAVLRQTTTLLAELASSAQPDERERALNQLRVRWLRQGERPQRLLESMALDWLALGRVRPLAEQLQALQAVSAEAVRQWFETLAGAGLSMALTGRVVRGLRDQVPGWLAVPLAGAAGLQAQQA